MPKTKKSSRKVTKKTVAVKKVTVKAPHMTRTIFGASYLLILAVLSLLLITIASR
ncbi:MAG TPA: hypothetical protein VF837_00385 [Patescibacteria group bacterium]